MGRRGRVGTGSAAWTACNESLIMRGGGGFTLVIIVRVTVEISNCVFNSKLIKVEESMRMSSSDSPGSKLVVLVSSLLVGGPRERTKPASICESIPFYEPYPWHPVCCEVQCVHCSPIWLKACSQTAEVLRMCKANLTPHLRRLSFRLCQR